MILRKTEREIRKSAEAIYHNCPEPFKFLVGDIIDYNVKKWGERSEIGTVGQDFVLKHGFTQNQIQWIFDTNRMLKSINKLQNCNLTRLCHSQLESERKSGRFK